MAVDLLFLQGPVEGFCEHGKEHLVLRKMQELSWQAANYFKFTWGTELQIVSFTSVFSALHGSEGSEYKLQVYGAV